MADQLTGAAAPAQPTKTVAVIDGNSLMHRAYHAVPPTMNAPDGTPTNAVFGFLSMFLKFYELYVPDAIVCAFDAGKPSHRIAALGQYKAQRPPMDQELRVQFPLMEQLLTSMNVPVVKVQGWEGDDVLGTIAARDEALGYKTLLVTGDKDANQLASSLTHIITTKKGITDVVEFDPEKVREKYGVGPEQFTDFLGLMGDASDNIPGVPGIGPKTAAKLLDRFGSMEGIYQNLDQLKGKQLENLQNNRDAAFLSREIAVIKRDLDFECDLESAAFPAFDPQAVQESFGALQLTMHLGKVLGLLGQDAAPVPAMQLDWEPVLEGAQGVGLVKEALGEGSAVGAAFCQAQQASLFEPQVRMAFATAKGTALLEGEEALAVLEELIKAGSEKGEEAPLLATLNAKELFAAVYPRSTARPARVTDEQLRSAHVFDLGLAGYALNSTKAPWSLEDLAQTYWGSALPEGKDEAESACIAAAACAACVDPLASALQKDQSWDVYHKVDLPLVSVLARMERTGAAIDVDRLAQLGASAGESMDQLRARIIELAGEDFNVDSPKQLSRILFEVLGLTPGKKTRSGYSTDASELGRLSAEHELPGLVLKYRELAKIKSTYIDALPRLREHDGDGRVHTTFHETVTATGRLSSSDPNLQNIPVRTDFGRQIRRCFVPLQPGHVFVSADYSQIELRLLAHLSGDQGLIDAFNSGQDFHAQTAARVFGVPADQVTPQMRSKAKAVNFGIVYGQQAFGLSQSLGVSFAEAKEMIDRYYVAYPGVRAYLDSVVEDAKLSGYAETLWGRKRHIPELRSRAQRGFGERTAMNHPMQGTAADVIKLAMVRVRDAMLEAGLDAHLLLQVHDELDFSCAADQVDQLSVLVKQAMEGVVQLQVPLVVDVQSGPTWAEAH